MASQRISLRNNPNNAWKQEFIFSHKFFDWRVKSFIHLRLFSKDVLLDEKERDEIRGSDERMSVSRARHPQEKYSTCTAFVREAMNSCEQRGIRKVHCNAARWTYVVLVYRNEEFLWKMLIKILMIVLLFYMKITFY